MPVAGEWELGEVAAGVFRTLVADLVVHVHPAEGVVQLGVYEVRSLEVAVSARRSIYPGAGSRAASAS
ncbi:MAG TPA: hypothetical protein VGG08_10990 [Solirubrobacteraceae bacterium]|jgi:hypothetical protein